jgi:hypothetical protein
MAFTSVNSFVDESYLVVYINVKLIVTKDAVDGVWKQCSKIFTVRVAKQCYKPPFLVVHHHHSVVIHAQNLILVDIHHPLTIAITVTVPLAMYLCISFRNIFSFSLFFSFSFLHLSILSLPISLFTL